MTRSTIILMAGFALGACADSSRVEVERPQIPASPLAAVGAADFAAPGAVEVRRKADGAFPSRLRYAERELLLNGAGLCEWGILAIDLYEAALWVERPVESIERACRADQVMVIHLDFSSSLSEAQLREAYSASAEINAGDEFESYREPLGELLDTMRAVSAGDTYTFISDPERGLQVQRGDEVVATIRDDRFRRLFVRLYLGDKPPTDALRDGLLGVE